MQSRIAGVIPHDRTQQLGTVVPVADCPTDTVVGQRDAQSQPLTERQHLAVRFVAVIVGADQIDACRFHFLKALCCQRAVGMADIFVRNSAPVCDQKTVCHSVSPSQIMIYLSFSVFREAVETSVASAGAPVSAPPQFSSAAVSASVSRRHAPGASAGSSTSGPKVRRASEVI